MARFTIVPPSRFLPSVDTPFALQQDRWDDYGFKTQYHLHNMEDETDKFLGNVKILQLGQSPSASSLLKLGPLDHLDDSFCSLGQSLDYYERIASLPADIGEALLQSLRDCVADPSLIERFEKEEGWQTSILREIGDFQEFQQLASVLLSRNYSALAALRVDMKFSVAGWETPLELMLAAPEEGIFFDRQRGGARNRQRLPQRLAVITGRNGSGKSTLLARLARVLHASQQDRDTKALRQLGELYPRGLGFTRIIAIGYSAFDTFQVPGLSERERTQIAADIKAGKGRYIFCGLRDIALEMQETLAATRDDALPPHVSVDRQAHVRLKAPGDLAREFAVALDRIRELAREPLLEEIAALLLNDPSFSDVTPRNVEALVGDDPELTFMGWSTGHKIAIHSVCSLLAYAQPKSIALIDEPESHLHPPLLAAMMHSIRFILEELDSFALVATHSPVVAQETLSRHVRIVRRENDTTTIRPPLIETYGESIGQITDDVFGLHADATDYHQVLRGLVERLGSLAEIEAVFENGMSLQARAYIMSLLAAREQT